ncbi:S-methyl-5-thioribose kinase [Pseudalkalibacillus caeni]|uniref:Methylthioribose kinase n=1 Tax=Exobacillus caeni TaxID=2574798 RepID=A0A5R9F5I6_9BACL|nr:S-methyl-5-thioribose kinase [Pseudalkalibacillus caeni]TLS38301.1 S-methyl-5-thioribose kinase [Pseudalkalibacillus caeni]
MITKQTAYEPFTTDSVVDYLKQRELINPESPVVCEEIGDGNLNYVFRVTATDSNRSLIVKQALPYAKVVGESWPLTLDRARIESESLLQAAKVVPELVPAVYENNPVLASTVMEDLSSHTVLRKGLIEGKRYPELAKHIGTYLAYTLFYSSDFGLEPAAKKELATRFVNPDLCNITEDLVFTDPFFDHETNDFPEALRPDVEEIWADDNLKLEAAKLKQLFLTKGEALIHGDLHTGSVFVTEGSTKVIDPEFAFLGPIGFDVGAFIANLILNYLSQEARLTDTSERNEFQDYLLAVIKETWEVFTETFSGLWKQDGKGAFITVPGYLDYVLSQILQETVGFAGCKIIRRTIGLSHVEDIDGIENSEARINVQRAALQVGRKLILKRESQEKIEDVIALVRGAGNE